MQTTWYLKKQTITIWASRIVLLGLAITLNNCAGCKGPLVYDDSPNTDNGMPPGGPSTAGITVGVAGTNAALYAVSANAGVWRSTSSSEDARSASAWVQLASGPPRAFSIAVDPNQATHISVGQRDGDQIANNNSGVWESFDSGNSWPNYFDPRQQPGGCGSQAISSVAFSRKSTLFFSTLCGLGVKKSGANQPSYPPLPGGATPISAVAASESKLWARTPNGTLFVSIDEGTSWQLATQKQLPENGNDFASTRGDSSSLGVFDEWAFMSSGGQSNGSGNNFSQLTILDVVNDRWIVQSRINNALNGTGAGGRRQVKTYIFGTNKQLGSDRQLYFSNSQEIYHATSQNQDGTFSWGQVLQTSASGSVAPNQQYQNIVHNDIWDFNVAARGSDLWVATDGGVYQNTSANLGWLTRDSGLHTQHVQTLFVPQPDLHVAYATHDNNAWFRVSPGTWDHENSLGDATWVSGDVGNEKAGLLARRTGACNPDACRCAQVSGFGSNLPNGQPAICATLNVDGSFTGPEAIAFIQTMPSDAVPASPLDAVMLTKLPLQVLVAGALQNVPGRLGNPAADHTEDLVLIRNSQFANNPDINTSQGQGWQIVANNLPSGTRKFWVTGGHANAIFYVLAAQNGNVKLFKSSGSLVHQQLTTWQELDVQGNLLQPQPFPDSGILDGATLGPVFVNPYNPAQLYVLTNKGVFFSTDGGFSFNPDSSLTSLIRGGGNFPLTGTFSGSSGVALDFTNGYTSSSMGTLSSLSFNRKNPVEMVAASPFTGVFYNSGNGKWIDVTPKVASPLAPISDVAIIDDRITVALEGRGILHIDNFR